MKHILFSISACLALASCETNSASPVSSLAIKRTAAVEALGLAARSTPLLTSKTLKPGRIYRDKGAGQYSEICQKDFRDQRGLQTLQEVEEDHPGEQVADRVYQSTLTIAGLTGRVPYQRIAVTGYKIKRTDHEGDVPSHILSNLADKCLDEVLPKGPYIITSEVAVADSATVFGRDAIDSLGIPGIFAWRISEGEELIYSKRNAIFGFTGLKSSKK